MMDTTGRNGEMGDKPRLVELTMRDSDIRRLRQTGDIDFVTKHNDVQAMRIRIKYVPPKSR